MTLPLCCAFTLSVCPSGGVVPYYSDNEQSVRTGAVFVEVGAGRRSVHVTQLKNLPEDNIKNKKYYHLE